MHPLVRLPYAAAAALATLGARLAPRDASGKALRSLAARRGILARYAAWASHGRDMRRPLVWMHAPSVGEGLQARAVMPLLRARHPALQIAYTFYSPSAATFAQALGADFTDYLPFDTAHGARAALHALRPTALVFSKLDVWPVLVEEAARRTVRLGMISATMAEGSGRSGAFASMLLHDAYAALDAVGAVDASDADRLATLGVRRDRIRVTGDTRYDQVWARAAAADRHGALLGPIAGARPTLVAGSTWPADEAALFEAWRTVRARIPSARLIIAPHEPTARAVRPIEAWAAEERLTTARLGGDAQRTADVVVVDKVGVLGDLYALADVAFVGGGFHAAGLHSVIEPAAFGAPVLFGPQHQKSRDAGLLIAEGGAFSCADGRELGARLLAWLTERDARIAAGARARALVERGVGAADRSAALIDELLATS